MSVQIALLRGINVGGNRLFTMAELKSVFRQLGARDVRTYIQSGNVVYRGDLDQYDIAEAIATAKGFRPDVVVLPLESYASVLKGNPFAETADPKAVHLFFLTSPSVAKDEILSAAKRADEQFVLTERVLYLQTPGPLSRSLLARKLEQLLGVEATGRNWRTACKILDLAETLAK